MDDKRIFRKSPKNSHNSCFIFTEWNNDIEKENDLKNMPNLTVMMSAFVLEAPLRMSLENSLLTSG